MRVSGGHKGPVSCAAYRACWVIARLSWVVVLSLAQQPVAWADSPPGVDAPWRERFIHQNLGDAYKHYSAVVDPAAAELAAGPAEPALLKRRLQTAARYALAVGHVPPSEGYCEQAGGWIQEAVNAGPDFKSELFDVFAAVSFAGACKTKLPTVHVRQLAEELGDPARMYFVLVAEAHAQFAKDEGFRFRWLLDQAQPYAITGLQRALLAARGVGIEQWGRQAENAQDRAQGLAKERQRIQTVAQHVSPGEFPRLDVFAAFLFSRVLQSPAERIPVLEGVRKYAKPSVVSPSELSLFSIAYGDALFAVGRYEEALPTFQFLLDLEKRDASKLFLSGRVLATYRKMGTPGAYARGVELLEKMHQLADAQQDNPERSRNQSVVLSAETRFLEAFGKFEQALAAHKKQTALDLASAREAAEKAVASKVRREAMAQARLEDEQKYELQRTTEVQAARLKGWKIAGGVALIGALATGAGLALARRRSRHLAQVSAELAKRNEELEMRNRSRTQFLAAACHDLRQPAHALGMLVELGRDAHTRGNDFDPWIRNVERCSTLLADMLGELMDLGSLEGGAYKPSLADVELAEVLHDVVLNFGPIARRKGLLLDAPPAAFRVRSDRHLLRRIVFNVVSNAVKYTEQGRVEVHCQAQGAYVELRVHDTGPGIPPDRQEDIFRDYVRLDHSHAADGLGIGLTVVRRAVDLLGHQMTFKSAVGEGTTLTLSIPLSQSAALDVPGAALPAGADALKDLVVVLMEDDKEVRDAVSALMTRWGCQVVGGPDSSSVLQPLQAQGLRPGLVMTDLNLVNTDGLAELLALRQALDDPDLPALLVTGDLDASLATRAANARAYVAHKPLSPGKLESLLRQLGRFSSREGSPTQSC